MKHQVQEAFSGLLAGLLFGVGLALGGMADPGEVIGFLDWSGVWNPALVGVLGGAVTVSLIGFQLAPRRMRPWFKPAFPELPKKPIDRSLIYWCRAVRSGLGAGGLLPGPGAGRAGCGQWRSAGVPRGYGGRRIVAVVVGETGRRNERRRLRPLAGQAMPFSSSCSSPAWYISFMMSQPPMNSPLM